MGLTAYVILQHIAQKNHNRYFITVRSLTLLFLSGSVLKLCKFRLTVYPLVCYKIGFFFINAQFLSQKLCINKAVHI